MKPNRPTAMRAEVTHAFDGPSALEGRRRGVHVFFAVVRMGGIEDKAKRAPGHVRHEHLRLSALGDRAARGDLGPGFDFGVLLNSKTPTGDAANMFR